MGCARLVDVIKHLSLKAFSLTPSLERWSTKAKQAPSHYEVGSTMLDTTAVLFSKKLFVGYYCRVFHLRSLRRSWLCICEVFKILRQCRRPL